MIRDQHSLQLLFSYGTLQDRSVQLSSFGRELTGRPDALPGYARRVSGPYFNAEATSNPEDAVDGVVFEVTQQELAAADRYEEAAQYHRISAVLRSGNHAWVYVRA